MKKEQQDSGRMPRRKTSDSIGRVCGSSLRELQQTIGRLGKILRDKSKATRPEFHSRPSSIIPSHEPSRNLKLSPSHMHELDPSLVPSRALLLNHYQEYLTHLSRLKLKNNNSSFQGSQNKALLSRVKTFNHHSSIPSPPKSRPELSRKPSPQVQVKSRGNSASITERESISKVSKKKFIPGRKGSVNPEEAYHLNTKPKLSKLSQQSSQPLKSRPNASQIESSLSRRELSLKPSLSFHYKDKKKQSKDLLKTNSQQYAVPTLNMPFNLMKNPPKNIKSLAKKIKKMKVGESTTLQTSDQKPRKKNTTSTKSRKILRQPSSTIAKHPIKLDPSVKIKREPSTELNLKVHTRNDKLLSIPPEKPLPEEKKIETEFSYKKNARGLFISSSQLMCNEKIEADLGESRDCDGTLIREWGQAGAEYEICRIMSSLHLNPQSIKAKWNEVLFVLSQPYLTISGLHCYLPIISLFAIIATKFTYFSNLSFKLQEQINTLSDDAQIDLENELNLGNSVLPEDLAKMTDSNYIHDSPTAANLMNNTAATHTRLDKWQLDFLLSGTKMYFLSLEEHMSGQTPFYSPLCHMFDNIIQVVVRLDPCFAQVLPVAFARLFEKIKDYSHLVKLEDYGHILNAFACVIERSFSTEPAISDDRLQIEECTAPEGIKEPYISRLCEVLRVFGPSLHAMIDSRISCLHLKQTSVKMSSVFNDIFKLCSVDSVDLDTDIKLGYLLADILKTNKVQIVLDPECTDRSFGRLISRLLQESAARLLESEEMLFPMWVGMKKYLERGVYVRGAVGGRICLLSLDFGISLGEMCLRSIYLAVTTPTLRIGCCTQLECLGLWAGSVLSLRPYIINQVMESLTPILKIQQTVIRNHKGDHEYLIFMDEVQSLIQRLANPLLHGLPY